ncbi:hypothetical protein [Fimbriiglobus ruber]|uniref:hypothetical protein n=1 Tax=Fimbriiglobus ruber TaxID=1908690 RepID=UPI00137A1038|nr:hypothetical protein [Fimbriiglobus ruber]
MSEAVLDQQNKVKAVALTTARLETVLQEARKDEAKLKQILEMRRMKRRLRARRVK